MLMTVDEILLACGGDLVVAAANDVQVSGLSWDSREVSEGMAYAALVGAKVDGHKFIPGVIASGAALTLISHDIDPEVVAAAEAAGMAIIKVASVEDAITAIAAAWRKMLAGTVIAVTGSSGKTTTKNLINTVLSAGMPTVATLANQNNELGVPRTLLRAQADTKAVVVEMGMRGLGQLAELCEFVLPDIAVVSNVGQSHIELLGSRENIARAKGEPINALPQGGWAFLNVNNDYAATMLQWAKAEERDLHVCLFGRQDAMIEGLPKADAMVIATDVSMDGAGCPTFTLNYQGGEYRCTLQMQGLHNVDNALCAAALAFHLGMDAETIIAALEAATPVAGRQDLHRLPNGVTVIDDAYNANPDSMAASLRTFAAMDCAGNHVAILGDMGELGSFAKEGHRAMGELVVSLNVEKLICVGELVVDMIAAAKESGMLDANITHVRNWEEALQAARGCVKSGDCVLVKASHSMQLENVVEGLIADAANLR